MKTDAGIFISYRRSDAAGWAGRLSDSLKMHLHGVDIFRDIEDIPPGVEFDSYINEAVGSCRVLIALIGPQWLIVSGPDGKPRLEDPADFTRTEISAALKRNVRVIPALVGGAKVPAADQLPEELKPLVRRQAYELTDGRWAEDCRILADVLKPLVKPAHHISRGILVGSALLVLLLTAGVLAWYVKAGRKTATNPTTLAQNLSTTNPPAGVQPAPSKPSNSQTESKTSSAPPETKSSGGQPEEKPQPHAPILSHKEDERTTTKTEPRETQKTLAQKKYDEGATAVQEKRYDDAARLFKEASAAGSVDAMDALGVLYVNGNGVNRDYDQARQWFEKAASGGNASAMRNLCAIYDGGLGVSKDYEQARQWCEKGANAGSTSAMVMTGIMYQRGLGVAQDGQHASQWFRQAADKGDGEAMYRLGTMYAHGDGLPLDYAQGREWFLKATNSRNAVASGAAMYELGVLWENGYGVSKDYQQARQYYEKSAAGNYPPSMYALGNLYEHGNGVRKDRQQARDWYQKAANGGYKAAEARLQDLSR